MRLLSNTTFLIAVLATVAGCGGKTPIQPPPPPPPLELSCPVGMTRDATNQQGTDVHFDAPVPTGGLAPYSVVCDPGSSSVFAIGESMVRCTATDAAMAQAFCSFAVTVRVPQTIAKTQFIAFGDSLTEGAVSLVPLVMLDAPETYPARLQQMLSQRYPSQSIVVFNEGRGGEETRGGAERLPSVLAARKPEVMLLMEGINNINGLSTSTQASSLETMITTAQRPGVDVIIATLMPVRPTWRHYQAGHTAAQIQALNTQIFALAARYNLGAPVDLFAIFDASPELTGSDGLHPTAQGQTRIAEAFRDAIVHRYDRPSPVR